MNKKDVYSKDMDEKELLEVRDMPGSLNSLVSIQHKMRRPPSLSESFAWTPENIERSYKEPLLSPTTILLSPPPLPPSPSMTFSPSPEPSSTTTAASSTEVAVVSTIVKFLLHITLISLFETVFFFLYVAALENNGINKTVNTFIDGAIGACRNLTAPEIIIADDILDLLVNSSTIVADGDQAYDERTAFNDIVYWQAWYYSIGLVVMCSATGGYVYYRRLKLDWKSILLENLTMVMLLAVYEYVFFDTIIHPYMPITPKEIARNAIQEFQTQCGLF